MKRGKHFTDEAAFEYIWQSAARDGIWDGDASDLAAEFHVSEDAADEMLYELRNKRLIDKLTDQSYLVVNWRERD
jgi:hypothetical protein